MFNLVENVCATVMGNFFVTLKTVTKNVWSKPGTKQVFVMD